MAINDPALWVIKPPAGDDADARLAKIVEIARAASPGAQLTVAVDASTAAPHAGRPGSWVIDAGVNAQWLRSALAGLSCDAHQAGLWLGTATVLEAGLIEAFLAGMADDGLLSRTRVADAGLVLVELLANAVMHGNLADHRPCDAPVEWLRRGVAVHAVARFEELAVTVAQEAGGAARPKEQQPISSAGEHGRGLFIVRSLSDDVRFDSARRSCTVAFRRPEAGEER